MRQAIPLLIVAVALSSRAAEPTNIQLFSVDQSPKPVCGKGTLRAVPRCTGAACGGFAALIGAWAFQGGSAEVPLTLQPEVSWEVSIEGSNCWAAPVIIAADDHGETRTAFVWPAATIAGVFTINKGETPPKELHATVEAGDTAVPGASIPQTALACIVEDIRWRCVVPAATIDLRLEADGFTPRYFWGVHVDAGEKKTIGLTLARGPSVSGRVAFADRRAPLDGVSVELRPAGFAAGPADERHIRARSRKTTTSARGFFQFPAVDEGAYDVVVTKKGWSTAARRVRVGEAKETDAGILTLPPLARAEVIIDPPLDAKGRHWRVVLDREELPTQQAPIADKDTAADGTWTAGDVMAGSYRLNVYDGGGAAYERLTVNIRPGDPPLRFHMNALAVRGVVRIGREPLPAALRFMNTQAPGDLDLVTDDRGEFAGTFPSEGRYEVDVSPKESSQKLRRRVEIRSNPEGMINLDIELPGGIVRGKVVDESGNPVAAAVQILPSGSRRPMSAMAGEDGAFKLIGVESGDVVLNARDRSGRESGPMPHSIGDGESDPITLTLHPRMEFTMWLVSPAGQPVSGAVVRFSDGHYSHEQISGPRGEIRFAIARGIPSIDVIVAAAGFPVRMLNLPISPDMDTNPQIVLGASSAVLVAKVGSTPPWPALRPARSSVNLHYLPELFASPMGGPSTNRTARGYEFEIEPGNYLLCPDSRTLSKCVERTLSPGTESVVDFESLRERESEK